MKLETIELGSKAPSFSLPGVDGKTHSLDEFQGKMAVAVIFSCNHCPYVKKYEDRIVEVQRDYAAKGVQLIAINSNETQNYPEDDLPHMVERAREKGFNFPYLRDEDQSIARAYGPARTPEVFLLDKAFMLRYHGAIDDNVDSPTKVRRKYLREAVDSILAGKPIKTQKVPSVGCTIKWL